MPEYIPSAFVRCYFVAYFHHYFHVMLKIILMEIMKIVQRRQDESPDTLLNLKYSLL
jgi:hypothetical protein